MIAHIGGVPMEEMLPGALLVAGVALRMLRLKLRRATVTPASHPGARPGAGG